MKNVKYMDCALGSVMVKDIFWYRGITFDSLKQKNGTSFFSLCNKIKLLDLNSKITK